MEPAKWKISNAARLFELVNGGYTIGPLWPPDLRPGINGLGQDLGSEVGLPLVQSLSQLDKASSSLQ